MAKGLDWYILEADKNEKNYQYHVLMTLMEQEFNISFAIMITGKRLILK